jgi:hypothetical protein
MFGSIEVNGLIRTAMYLQVRLLIAREVMST